MAFSAAGFAAIILPQSLLASGCTALGASAAHIIDLASGCLSSVPFFTHSQGSCVHFMGSEQRLSAFCYRKGSFSRPLAPSRKIMLALFCTAGLSSLLDSKAVAFYPGLILLGALHL